MSFQNTSTKIVIKGCIFIYKLLLISILSAVKLLHWKIKRNKTSLNYCLPLILVISSLIILSRILSCFNVSAWGVNFIFSFKWFESTTILLSKSNLQNFCKAETFNRFLVVYIIIILDWKPKLVVIQTHFWQKYVSTVTKSK